MHMFEHMCTYSMYINVLYQLMCRHQWQVLCQPQIARAPSFLPRLPATSFLPPSCLSPPALAYHSIPSSPLHICNLHIFAHIWCTKMCKITKALPISCPDCQNNIFLASFLPSPLSSACPCLTTPITPSFSTPSRSWSCFSINCFKLLKAASPVFLSDNFNHFWRTWSITRLLIRFTG